MMKDEFLKILRSHLRKLPEKDRQEILSDYEEHFQHGFHNERTEGEIARSLGNPKKLARELMADYHLERAQENQSIVSLFRAAFIFLGLGFFNLVVIGPMIAVIALIFSLYVSSFVLSLTPLFVVGSLLTVNSLMEFLFNLFTGLIATGLGILLGLGTIRFSRAYVKWFVRYLKSNLNIIKGGDKHE
ncbi:Uncharacterized membrane protein [Marininema mesophilum]|uniref:Uncharacterized membrane protein n=1 Tax=Marininema mesophilum TaxID=1048340 RepID=A0A1H2ZMQ5_9BACL|nr:DUF1700 domain-containing protein [Marininema mesophilum]SDX18009.1 Uncharacterized membrane protein [Marininema mesophilum]